jgi:hypothetical protein
MTDFFTRRSAAILVTCASALVAGCASQGGATPEDNVGNYMVAPGKYQFFACPNLAQALTGLKTREAELASLIAKAGPDAGGSFVSAIAYRPEYMQTRGNIVAVRKEAAVKNCPPQVLEPPEPVKQASPASPARRKR